MVKVGRTSGAGKRRTCVPSLGGLLTVIGVATVCATAHGQRLAISDLGGRGEQTDAVDLLVRSMLSNKTRPLVPPAQLAAALRQLKIERIFELNVPSLAERVNADRVLIGNAESDPGSLSVTGRAFDRGGKALGAHRVSVSSGDIVKAAAELARLSAPALGVEPNLRVSASLAELAPYLRAIRAIGDRRNEAAVEAFLDADPGTAARVPALSVACLEIAGRTGLPVALRMHAALAGGDPRAALQIARENPDTPPEVRGVMALAHVRLGDLSSARRDLAALGRDRSVAAIRAAYHARAGDKSALVREVAPLLSDAAPSPGLLAVVASLPPGVLGQKTEASALSAAGRLPPGGRSVATLVALRALGSGASAELAAPLLDPVLLSLDQLVEGQRLLGKHPLAAGLASAIERRKAPPAVLDLAALVESNPGISGLSATQAHLLQIARPLQGLINQFPPMRAGAGVVAVAAIPGTGAPLWWPQSTDVALLGSAVQSALTTPPFQFRPIAVADGSRVDTEAPSLKRVANQSQADFVLLYGIAPAGLTSGEVRAKVTLVFYDPSGNTLLRQEASMGPETRLVAWRWPLIIGGGIGLVWLILGIYVWIVYVGQVTVDIAHDKGADKEIVCVLLTRKGKRPVIKKPEAFLADWVERSPRLRGLHHFRVKETTTFSRVRPGTWNVFVYGVYRKADTTRPIGDAFVERIKVRMRKETRVAFDLDPKMAEFHVSVVDGATPVGGALVWAEGVKDGRAMTDRSGNTILQVPHGAHTLMIEAKGITARRQHEVRLSRGIKVRIDLVRERRAKEIALSEDDFQFPGMRPPVRNPDEPDEG